MCILEVEYKSDTNIKKNFQDIIYFLSVLKYTNITTENNSDECFKVREKLFKKLVRWVDDELSNTDPSQSYDPLICPDFFDCIEVSLINLVSTE